MSFSGAVVNGTRNPRRLNDLPAISGPVRDITRNAPAQSRHPHGAWRKPPIRLNPIRVLKLPGFTGADSMPAIAADLMRAGPSIVPSDIPHLSDDECLFRLARAVQEHDSEHLDEVAQLIGRLAVTIE
jgi:hypothetical protein